jgi:hypothetical protein
LSDASNRIVHSAVVAPGRSGPFVPSTHFVIDPNAGAGFPGQALELARNATPPLF